MTERPQDEQNAAQTERPAHLQDDRRASVDPTENPAPHSPEADEEAIRKGEEILERVKPY